MHMHSLLPTLAGGLALAALLANPVSADEVLFEQNPNPTGAFSPDLDQFIALLPADNVELPVAATVTGVSWRGYFTSTPTIDVPFEVTFYGDDPVADVADVTNVLGSASLSTSVTTIDTGDDFTVGANTFDILEFSADIAGVDLPQGTSWFAVYADTTGDPATFAWMFNGFEGDGIVSQSTVGGPFSRVNDILGNPAPGALSFALTGTFVPEPAALSVIGLAGLGMLRRRR
jgi:hypothetical protein